jgi:hypothetical protein
MLMRVATAFKAFSVKTAVKLRNDAPQLVTGAVIYGILSEEKNQIQI